mmetsp:Transcript_64118/g.102101  ORF Transcript_64118/g.102101 Transcript_64118/m.102101 type:complete len:232 (+) Transcript_64118:445-1140(+)
MQPLYSSRRHLQHLFAVETRQLLSTLLTVKLISESGQGLGGPEVQEAIAHIALVPEVNGQVEKVDITFVATAVQTAHQLVAHVLVWKISQHSCCVAHPDPTIATFLWAGFIQQTLHHLAKVRRLIHGFRLLHLSEHHRLDFIPGLNCLRESEGRFHIVSCVILLPVVPLPLQHLVVFKFGNQFRSRPTCGALVDVARPCVILIALTIGNGKSSRHGAREGVDATVGHDVSV